MKSKRTEFWSGEGINPANRGITFSDDPNHPLWKIQIKFAAYRPMVELIKAPTHNAAVAYAKRKYEGALEVKYLGKATPGQKGVHS